MKIKAILLKKSINSILYAVSSPRRTCHLMMSYLAAVKVAIVVTVLLTQQAVRLLEKKNGAACFL